jgi:predicted component of viral defense system (DUF524 family)
VAPLLQATGPGWKLEFVGNLPTLPPFLELIPDTAVEATNVVSLECYDRRAGGPMPVSSGERIEPIFFEAVSYDVHFEKTDPNATLSLPAGAELRRSKGSSEHYVIDFGNNVGFAEFAVRTVSGVSRLLVEVFSRKADYRTDYFKMRDDVSSILRNLAMSANSKTFGLSAPEKGKYPTLAEWYELVKRHFSEFMRLSHAISKNPHSALLVSSALVRAEKARSISRRTIDRALRRNNIGPEIKRLGITLPRRLHESVAVPSFDTPENRYFKALVRVTHRNIRSLSRARSSGDEDADHSSETKFFDSIRPNLIEMEKQIEGLLKAPFFARVAEVRLDRPDSMLYRKHPLYSRLDRLFQLLNGGLSFTGEVIPIGVKQTSLLYEYWCFLKLIALLAERFDLEEQSVVQVNRLRITVSLAKGKASAFRFRHKPTGKALFLVYNRLFTRLPTIAQQPDNVIQFATDDRFYIFDAKYRIQFDRDYVRLYGGPGPTTDDVNTMHRYRDAIAIPHPMKSNGYKQGVVFGALVLFPLPDEMAYREHKFFRSIAQVEIGGLPFLPGSTSLVRTKLDSLLLSEFPMTSDERSSSAS